MAGHGELAAMLRAWRDRLQPAAVGLPTGQRRTPGLRREEVAMLAGLSVDYLVRLEQGRSERPSEQVVAALARALQLSEAELAQLYVATGLPAPLPSRVPRHIPASVQRLLARLPDVAISVYTSHWSLLTANATCIALLGPVGQDRNLIVEQFTGTGVAVRLEPDYVEIFERALVSDLRRAALRYPDDPSVRELIEKMSAVERFAAIWAEGTVVQHRSKRKTFVHHLVGDITVDCDVFTAIGSDLLVVTYTAEPGTEDASRFDLIRTVGWTEVSSPAAAGGSAGG